MPKEESNELSGMEQLTDEIANILATEEHSNEAVPVPEDESAKEEPTGDETASVEDASEEDQDYYTDEELIGAEVEDLDPSRLTPGQKKIIDYAKKKADSAKEQISGAQQRFRELSEMRKELQDREAKLLARMDKLEKAPLLEKQREIYESEDEADELNKPYRDTTRKLESTVTELKKNQEQLKRALTEKEIERNAEIISGKIWNEMEVQKIPKSEQKNVEDLAIEFWEADKANERPQTPIKEIVKKYQTDLTNRVISFLANNPGAKKQLEIAMIKKLKKKKGGPSSPPGIPPQDKRPTKGDISPEEELNAAFENLAMVMGDESE